MKVSVNTINNVFDNYIDSYKESLNRLNEEYTEYPMGSVQWKVKIGIENKIQLLENIKNELLL